MSEPVVYIVILNWNGKDVTLECLDSVLKINYKNFRVVVVDNGSQEKIGGAIEARYDNEKVHLIENEQNLGFTGGNNVGIKYALDAGAEYVLLLNNDTVVHEDLLGELVKVALGQDKPGIVGPKIYYFDEPERLWFAGNKRSYVYGKPTQIGHRGLGEVDCGQYDVVEELGFVTGCALFVRRDVFEAIGLLDDDYFCSCEDADFCIRANKAGFKLYYAPGARLWHKEACDLAGLDSPGYVYYQIRNRLLLMKKNFPWWGWIVFVPAFCLILSRRGAALLAKKNLGGFGAMWRGVWDFWKGNYGKRGL